MTSPLQRSQEDDGRSGAQTHQLSRAFVCGSESATVLLHVIHYPSVALNTSVNDRYDTVITLRPDGGHSHVIKMSSTHLISLLQRSTAAGPRISIRLC